MFSLIQQTKMKRLALILSLLASTAHAGADLPPEEYDKPYWGTLTIEQDVPQDQIRAACVGGKLPTAFALACSFKIMVGRCHIMIAPEADIKARGYAVDTVMRHEIGHCNGWPADHRGGRPAP